jgi:hypothetical protein
VKGNAPITVRGKKVIVEALRKRVSNLCARALCATQFLPVNVPTFH